LMLLAAIDTIIYGVVSGALGAILLYAIGHFKLNAELQSIFMATVNLMRVFCLLVVLPILARIFRGKQNGPKPRTGADLFELNIIRAGIFIDMLGFVGYIFSNSIRMFIASGVITSVGGIGSPTLQAVLTKHVPHDRVGRMLGGLGFLHGIGKVVGPLVFNILYALTVRDFDRAIFVLLTAMFGVVFVLACLVKPEVQLNLDDEFTRRESVAPEFDDDPLL